MCSYKLYVDDLRNPKGNEKYVIARSSREAIELMTLRGCPIFISFDHDLGGDDIAMIIVKWMIERDLDLSGQFIPSKFEFNVHSANPVGAKNIQSLLDNYLRTCRV